MSKGVKAQKNKGKQRTAWVKKTMAAWDEDFKNGKNNGAEKIFKNKVG